MTKLAVKRGAPVRKEPFTEWPIVSDEDRGALLRVLNSGKWGRHLGTEVLEFEEIFADMHSVNICVTITNGTAALEIALRAADIGVGDEVIVPPYTFVATATAVMAVGALPIFVDIDPETYCMHPELIADAITPHTKAIMPVHIAGGVSHMDVIQDLAEKNDLIIIEDACQAHLAEWDHKKVGTLGDLACFSFQASKNINSGEGGAIIGNNEELVEKCYSIHTCGRVRDGIWYQHPYLGTNARMTEFQGALLKSQIKNAEEQTQKREENATYLRDKINAIPGLSTLGEYEKVTRNVYHLFVVKFNQSEFEGLSRDTYLKALQAEGIPSQAGYVPLYNEGFIQDAFQSTTFQRGYNPKRLEEYPGNIHCPNTEFACNSESIWIPQNVLLGETKDMDDVVNAFEKVTDNYKDLL